MVNQWVFKNSEFRQEAGTYKIYCFFNGRNNETRLIGVTRKRLIDEWNYFYKSAMVNGKKVISEEFNRWWHEVRADRGEYLCIKQLAQADTPEEADEKLAKAKREFSSKGSKLIDLTIKERASYSNPNFALMTMKQKEDYGRFEKTILRIVKDYGKTGIHESAAIRMVPRIYDHEDARWERRGCSRSAARSARQASQSR